MSEGTLRPISSMTEIRSRVSETATEIPVLSVSGFREDADKMLGDECIRCSAFITDVYGWPVMTGCQRGLRQEDGFAPPRNWSGGTPVAEIEWRGVIDVVTSIPDPIPLEWANRTFIFEDSNGDQYTFNVVARQDGVLFIDWINEPPNDSAVELELTETLTITPRYPTGVAIDPSGNVYVAARGGTSQAIRKYNASLVLQWVAPGDASDSSWSAAADGTSAFVAFGSDSRIYKRQAGSGGAGSPATIGTTGSGAGQLLQPKGVVSNGTHIFVADSSRSKILKYTVAGAYVSEFGVMGSGPGEFDGISGIALDSADNIYVCDAHNHRIQKFSSAYAWLATFGTVGFGDGQFNYPRGVAVDSTTGEIWVADTGNHRIQLLDSSGAFLGKIGSFGSGTDQLNGPLDIALGDGFAYVADYSNRRISRVRVAPAHTHGLTTVRRTNSATAPTGGNTSLSASCLPGELITGIGCDIDAAGAATVILRSRIDNTTQGTCTYSNTSGATRTVTAQAMCIQGTLD